MKGYRALSHRELILLRRLAEDAIYAANRHYPPFVDAVSHPLNILSLVDMAIDSLSQDKVQAHDQT